MEYTCGNCGGDIEDMSLGKCPHCETEFELPENRIPWEERATTGFFSALTATWLLSVTRPLEFFRRPSIEKGFMGPFLYAYIMGLIGSYFSLGWQNVLNEAMPLEDTTYSGSADDLNLMIALLTPFILPIGIFLGAGFIHLVLLTLGVGKAGFEATFKVVCYSSGPSVLSVIPWIGGFIAWGWSTVIEVIGLREYHKISTGRAVAGVMIPLIILLGCILALFSMMAQNGMDSGLY